jgi:predicted lipid-binding transport protein (Tim44 family)
MITLIIAFGLCFWLSMRMFNASQKQRLNSGNSYEEYVRDRRDARRRARANARRTAEETENQQVATQKSSFTEGV